MTFTQRNQSLVNLIRDSVRCVQGINQRHGGRGNNWLSALKNVNLTQRKLILAVVVLLTTGNNLIERVMSTTTLHHCDESAFLREECICYGM